MVGSKKGRSLLRRQLTCRKKVDERNERERERERESERESERAREGEGERETKSAGGSGCPAKLSDL